MSAKERKPYGITPEPPEVNPNGRYTMADAAQRLRLHRNTVSVAFRDGHLRAIDPCARKVRFSGKELMRYWRWKTA